MVLTIVYYTLSDVQVFGGYIGTYGWFLHRNLHDLQKVINNWSWRLPFTIVCGYDHDLYTYMKVYNSSGDL